jgi:hypothetical protein
LDVIPKSPQAANDWKLDSYSVDDISTTIEFVRPRLHVLHGQIDVGASELLIEELRGSVGNLFGGCVDEVVLSEPRRLEPLFERIPAPPLGLALVGQPYHGVALPSIWLLGL